MPLRLRRLLPLALAGLLLVPAAAPALAATTTDAIADAERDGIALLNAERTKRGLVPVRIDTRLMAIARDRSEYQAKTGVMSHSEAGGRNVFDYISDAGIKWYGAGEIIAWNNWPTLADSGRTAVSGWLGSSGHRAIMLSKDYNYVGLGLALGANGRKYWTGVYMKGPDRTGAYATTIRTSKQAYDATRRRITFSWSGADTRLQVLTAGLRDFQAQRRVAGGVWRNFTHVTTTRTSMSFAWTIGVTYEFRVRARDRAGNWGAWRTVSVRI